MNLEPGWRWTMAWIAPAVLSFALAGPVVAQEEAGAGAPRTGDAWVDETLADMADYAARHRDAFVDELVRYQATPRALAEEALSTGVAAGDLYYACAIAQALGRPCREVLQARRQDPTANWSDIAGRLDEKQSSNARTRVKRGIVESYDRWARPIELDASLRRAFPKRPAATE